MNEFNQSPSKEAISNAILDATKKQVELITKPVDYEPLKQSEVHTVHESMNRDVIKTLGERVVSIEDDRMVDEMTGAGSLYAFNNDLDAILKQRPEDARIILLDLNGFKEVNDLLGHEVGDEALRQFVGGIDEVALRTGEKIYRIGGDEFVILSDLEVRRDRRQKSVQVNEERRKNTERRTLVGEESPSRRQEDLKELGKDDTPQGLEKRINNGFKGADYIFRGYLERINLINESIRGSQNYIDPESWKIHASWGIADYEPGDTKESLKERADAFMYSMKRRGSLPGDEFEQLELFSAVE